jgi:septal ring-binding cell division protein DamX
MPRAEAIPNPLASRRRTAPQTPLMHPMKAHAAVWQHVNSLSPDDLAKTADRADYSLPLLGELAGNPKVNAKDVIKAASQAAADGKITPTEAVQFISGMPDDASKLQGWLRGLYAVTMTTAVHAKAAQMKAAQQQPVAAAAPVQAPTTPSTPTSLTPGEAA